MNYEIYISFADMDPKKYIVDEYNLPGYFDKLFKACKLLGLFVEVFEIYPVTTPIDAKELEP